MARFSQVNFNAREELLTSDLNRASALMSRDMQDYFQDEGRGDLDTTVGLTGVNVPMDGGIRLPTIAPIAATRTFNLGAGQAFLLDSTATGDNSTNSVVRWSAQVVTYTNADGANARIDLIVATPVDAFTDAYSRNVLVDPTAPAVSALTVYKTQNPEAVISVVAGVAGASPVPPAVPAGSIALFEVYIPVAPGGDNASNTILTRRLFRRATHPFSGGWGIVRGFDLQWSDVNEAGLVASVPSFTVRNSQVLIDGEILEFRSGFFTPAICTVLPPTVSVTQDTPFYIYACGGRNLPQSMVTPAPFREPVSIVFSARPPDSSGVGYPSGTIGTPRGTTIRGATYIGVGFTIAGGGATTWKQVRYVDDMVYAIKRPFYNATAPSASPTATGTFTLVSKPSPSDFALLVVTATAATAGDLFAILSDATAAWNLDYHLFGTNALSTVKQVSYPLISSTGVVTWRVVAGGANMNFLISSGGYNMKVNRFSA